MLRSTLPSFLCVARRCSGHRFLCRRSPSNSAVKGEAMTSAEATWNGAVLATTDKFEMVEGNVYFPASSVSMQYMKPSSTHTFCDWKGDCSYYTVEVDGKQNKDAAWFYPAPYPAAANIKDHIAFWKGVTVQKKP